MNRWLTISWKASAQGGREADVKGVQGIKGCIAAAGTANSDTECLVLVVRDQGPLDELKGKPGVHHHGDESETVGPDGRKQRVIPAQLRAALRAEAARLGASGDWQPDGYSVRV